MNVPTGSSSLRRCVATYRTTSRMIRRMKRRPGTDIRTLACLIEMRNRAHQTLTEQHKQIASTVRAEDAILRRIAARKHDGEPWPDLRDNLHTTRAQLTAQLAQIAEHPAPPRETGTVSLAEVSGG